MYILIGVVIVVIVIAFIFLVVALIVNGSIRRIFFRLKHNTHLWEVGDIIHFHKEMSEFKATGKLINFNDIGTCEVHYREESLLVEWYRVSKNKSAALREHRIKSKEYMEKLKVFQESLKEIQGEYN